VFFIGVRNLAFKREIYLSALKGMCAGSSVFVKSPQEFWSRSTEGKTVRSLDRGE
jgi:hypothetical protein